MERCLLLMVEGKLSTVNQSTYIVIVDWVFENRQWQEEIQSVQVYTSIEDFKTRAVYDDL